MTRVMAAIIAEPDVYEYVLMLLRLKAGEYFDLTFYIGAANCGGSGHCCRVSTASKKLHSFHRLHWAGRSAAGPFPDCSVDTLLSIGLRDRSTNDTHSVVSGIGDCSCLHHLLHRNIVHASWCWLVGAGLRVDGAAR